MIKYTCDQCNGPISDRLRVTATTEVRRDEHFCSVICFTGWANKTGYRSLPSRQPDITPPAAPPKPKVVNSRDQVEHTCEICGRVGTRRYTPTGKGGWRCAPSATACSGNQPDPVSKIPNPVLTKDLDEPAPSDIPAKQFPPKVTLTPGVTARCQDCSRFWNLTGRVLQAAVDTHEFQKGHIVTVLELEVSG